MVDVDFKIPGSTPEEARERADKARTMLRNKYENDAKRNDDTFLERLEQYKEEIVKALALPPDMIEKMRITARKSRM